MNNVTDYIIQVEELNLEQILETWAWLTGKDKTVIALTKMGDAILKDKDNKLYHLDTGCGKLELKSDNYLDFFQGKLESEEYELMLLPNLIKELEENGRVLATSQVYALHKIPLLGGTYEKENISMVYLYEHYSLSGEIHSQLKNLPEGTKVNFRIVE